jgi:hypothetical protein
MFGSVVHNGTKLNGIKWNGMEWNGIEHKFHSIIWTVFLFHPHTPQIRGEEK